MKTLLMTTAIMAGLAAPALAQDANTMFQTEAAGPSVTASDLIGARIYASEAAVDAESYAGVQEGWNDIGEVNDLVIGRDGTVDAVLVDIGGFLGIGERQVAVDMAALRFVQDDATDVDDWFLVLQADRASLDTAPEWVMPGYDNRADVQTDGTVATDGTTGEVVLTDDAATAQTRAEADAQAQVDAQAQADANATQPAEGTVAADVDAGARGAMTLPEGYTSVDRTVLTAEMLTGANVRDLNDSSIAEISDLVLTGEGQVTDVILDVGGFLGIGARSVAIPLDRLTVAQGGAGDVAIWVDMSKEELEALPEYKM